jgi:radical SAM protein (TIGR01212 family)
LQSTYERPELWVQENHWRTAGLRYFSYKFFLRNQFGLRVQRVSVDGGFTCPNVDGKVAHGGCTFCDNRSFSPSRRLPVVPGPRRSVADQLAEGIRRLQRRYTDCEQFIAYFQPATNTYAPVDRLRSLYDQALAHPQVIGLAIGTRPDCVPNAVLDLLSELAERTFLSVEYGMQTIHARSLDWMNRGHYHDAMVDAVARSRGRGFEIGAHVILGLPGESRDDMQQTARELARLNVDAVKLHNLYVVERTPLADQLRQGQVQLIDRTAYVDSVVDTLERLPPHTVVQRMGGEAPGEYFVAPTWCLDKTGLRLAIDEQLRRRDTWQGKYYEPP